ncbi:MAG: hypothetical protein JXR07_14065 [Reichenbachiella sp.]
MRKQITIRFIVLLGITAILGLWRVLSSHMDFSEWSTFSPLGAMALFGGSYFSSRSKAYAFPILILLISDLVLMHTVYAEFRSGLLYSGWYWTYGSFALMVTIGEKIKRKVNVKNFILAALSAGLIHFAISNFGVWLGSGINLLTGMPYSSDIHGLINCYIAAIPYFKTLLLGNLIFGSVLFGGFEFAQSKLEILHPLAVRS